MPVSFSAARQRSELLAKAIIARVVKRKSRIKLIGEKQELGTEGRSKSETVNEGGHYVRR